MRISFKKAGSLVNTSLFFLPFLIVLTEAYKYPGFFQKYFFLSFDLILIISLTLSLFLLLKTGSLHRKSKTFLYSGIIFFLIGWIGEYLNTVFYENFFYEKTHFTALILLKSSIFLLITYLLILSIKKESSAISGFFLLLSSLLLIHHFNTYSLSNFSFNFFDGALSFLAHYYAKMNLIPYKEFGFPYPPLRFILLGKIIPFDSIQQRDFLFSLFVILIFAIVFFLINKQTKLKKEEKHIQLIILAILTIISLNNVPYEPFFIPLLTLYTTGVVFLKNTQSIKRLLIFYCLITPLLWFSNWHASLFLFALEIVFLTFCAILKRKNLAKAFGAKIFSHILGFSLLLLFILYHRALNEAILFLYTIHKRALPFRLIPLPETNYLIHPNNMFYTAIISIVIITMLNISKVREISSLDLNYLYLTSLPLIFLSYALGRSDFPHFIPLFQTTLISLLILFSLKKLYLHIMTFLILINILAAFPLIYSGDLHIAPVEKNKTLRELETGLTDCKEKVKGLKYKRIFVTRDNYTNFKGVTNSALYLIDPETPPATPFLHDEVNVQSSCRYGEIVVEYLKRTEKPILTFIEEKTSKDTPPYEIPSCGKIEKWLSTEKYKEISTCASFGNTYKIRLYY